MKKAIFPGSFDPLTLGHCEIIEKATQIFDEVIVAVGNNSEKTYKFPASDEDIAFASVAAQGHWIKTKQITSQKLTEIYLNRINKFQGQLNCYAKITSELALAEADAMDLLTEDNISLGPLHGIPYGLKDLFDTKDIETAWGAEPYQNRLPLEDAEIVKRLRAAGAVLLGKTAVGALAV